MPPFMTDTYIKKDYSRIDNVIDKVVQFVFGDADKHTDKI